MKDLISLCNYNISICTENKEKLELDLPNWNEKKRNAINKLEKDLYQKDIDLLKVRIAHEYDKIVFAKQVLREIKHKTDSRGNPLPSEILLEIGASKEQAVEARNTHIFLQACYTALNNGYELVYNKVENSATITKNGDVSFFKLEN